MSSCITVRVLHPNAAGIDIGASEHFVAVPPDRDPQPVRNGRRCHDAATIAAALHGNWRADHLFRLRQAVALFD
ncbi:MAG: hypothetical protein HYX53_01255, partial [Chloroflexi bacterium]|nr:hypothetical protein [Chloroflexota bacterium]